MKYFPVNFDVRDRKAVVVGGGKVALRKVRLLRSCGAKVTVISPECIGTIKKMKGVSVVNRRYRTGDLRGAFLAISATNVEAVNQRVCRDANRKGLPVNVVDCPRLCTFTVPASISHGHLMITISTGGGSPAFARRMRTDIEKLISPALVKHLDLMHETRPAVRNSGLGLRDRMEVSRLMASVRVTAAIRRGGVKAGRRMMTRRLAQAIRSKTNR
jgi:precorrin-2 dehydrogenase/sirohydrochlorin ferrochelatase